MTDYKGSDGDLNRARMLQRQREEQQKLFEEKKKQIASEARTVTAIQAKFAAKSDDIEEAFKQATVGLVSAEEFRKKREVLEKEQQKTEAKKRRHSVNKKKKQVKKARAKLSFSFDEEEEEEDFDAVVVPKKKSKVGKNPFVDTGFLPDRDREEAERKERERLEKVWEEEQEKTKKKMISVTYSFYDGSGHRRSCIIPMGTTVGDFLKNPRDEFPELRNVSAGDLMFIKEDLIIPQDISFYDLIVTKARGKSGPLYDFAVHDDVRAVSDATVETNETHAAKVVERRWYDKNKHIFPASRWEIYDPKADYGRYTIHGDEVVHE